MVISPPATTRVLPGLGGRGPPDGDAELAKSGAFEVRAGHAVMRLENEAVRLENEKVWI